MAFGSVKLQWINAAATFANDPRMAALIKARSAYESMITDVYGSDIVFGWNKGTFVFANRDGSLAAPVKKSATKADVSKVDLIAALSAMTPAQRKAVKKFLG